MSKFEEMKKLFIVDNGRLLSDDIFKLLVDNGARMTKDGTTKDAGKYERLTKKKKEQVYIIMDKAWEFLERKNYTIFTMDDYLILNRLGIEANKKMKLKSSEQTK